MANQFYLQSYLESYVSQIMTQTLSTTHASQLIDAGIDLSVKSLDAIIKPTKDSSLGDFQVNGVLALAKRIKTNPQALANNIANAILKSNAGIIDKAQVAGPGFINLTLNNKFISDFINQLFTDLGQLKLDNALTIVIDYSSPNIAKEMHVGHLRSTLIGDSTASILEFLGHKVIRQNHIGDWGTQFGMLIAYLELMQKETDKLDSYDNSSDNLDISDLDQFYRSAKSHFDNDPAFAEHARNLVVKLQALDPYCIEQWQRLVDITLTQNNKIYSRLGITLTDADVKGESSYNDQLALITDELLTKGIATMDQGAVVVFLDQFKNKDNQQLGVLIRKSDGGYLYTTTDLAAINHRANVLGADRLIYTVDSRQAQHFKQLEIIARQAGFLPQSTSLEHQDFGMILGQDNKPFKSRSGDVIKLNDLIDEAINKASALVIQRENDYSDEEKAHVINSLAIGSLKYADLTRNRSTDYVFNWDTMLNFEGNTAPYLLYAYARINSIFVKNGLDLKSCVIKFNLADDCTTIERDLAMKVISFPSVIEQASAGHPHLISSYLFETAQLFSSFYENSPIMGSTQQESRLSLAAVTANVLRTGLKLLGIETLDRM